MPLEPLEQLRIGVLGLGGIATKRFLPAAQNMPGVVVTALGTRNVKRIEDDESILRGDARVLSYDELVDTRPKLIDAVYIALPNDMHKEWIVRCAKAGLHVLCEKPMVPTRQAGEECRRVCAENQVLLAEAFAYRHDPRHARVAALLKEEVIGEVHLIEAWNSYFLNDLGNIRLSRDRLGGALMDVGCYGIDLARFLLGTEPSDISAQCLLGAQSNVDQVVGIVMRFGTGVLALATASTQLIRRNGYRVLGSKGEITVPWAFNWRGSGRPRVVIEQEGQEPTVLEFDLVDTFRVQLHHFAECIRTNAARLVPPLEDGLENAACVEAAANSMCRLDAPPDGKARGHV